MYLHFKEDCLKNFDETHIYDPGENYNFQHIKIDKNTASALSDNKKTFLESLGIHWHLILYILIFEVFFCLFCKFYIYFVYLYLALLFFAITYYDK